MPRNPEMHNELPPEAQPRFAKDLIATARRLVNAQKRRRTLRRRLVETEGEIKIARKQLHALAASLAGDQLPPRFKALIERRKGTK